MTTASPPGSSAERADGSASPQRGGNRWNRAALAVVPAAIIGGVVGLFHCEWQSSLEVTQVLAGTVDYPANNPYYFRHVQAWTLVSQACVPFAALGISTETLSIAISGSMGAFAFGTFALVVFAVCRNVPLALVGSLAIYHLFGTSLPYNSAYHIQYLGTIHTFGVFGQMMALLCVAMAGMDRPRIAGFCLAVAPAVHPTWGLWAVGVVGLAILWEKPSPREFLKRWGPGLLAGGLVTTASLAWQLWRARIVPSVPADVQQEYVEAFLSMWDYHRSRRVAPFEEGMLLTLASIPLALAFLYRYRPALPLGTVRLLRITAISGTLAYLLAVLTPWLPEIVVRAIPARFITLSALLFPLLLLGVLGMDAGNRSALALLVFHVAYLLGHDWIVVGRHWHFQEFLACAALAIIFCLAHPSSKSVGGLPNWLNTALLVTCAVLLVGDLRRVEAGSRRFAEISGTGDTVITAMAEGSGVLIVADDIPLIQLRTGRPVLVFGWMLDDLVYFPNLGPATNAILKQVYGIDLFDPPRQVRESRPGALPAGSSRELWERRTRTEWERIGAEHHATQVLTHGDTKLRLPLVARSRTLKLYAIPER